ncbi:hypothetical protein ABZ137_36995 [Streptomyces bobili]|uniref:hypothetical protein n=1 Tax=Streptomyces bobili TaxID=67280 RepID=UPI0033A92239
MPRIRTRVRPGGKSPSAIDSDPGRYENRLLPLLAPFISEEIHLMTGFLGLPPARSLMVEASRENRRGLHMGLLQGSVGQAVEGERSPVGGTV